MERQKYRAYCDPFWCGFIDKFDWITFITYRFNKVRAFCFAVLDYLWSMYREVLLFYSKIWMALFNRFTVTAGFLITLLCDRRLMWRSLFSVHWTTFTEVKCNTWRLCYMPIERCRVHSYAHELTQTRANNRRTTSHILFCFHLLTVTSSNMWAEMAGLHVVWLRLTILA